MAERTYQIAVIPGDGIGTEVVSAGIEVLQALAKREGPGAPGVTAKTEDRTIPEGQQKAATEGSAATESSQIVVYRLEARSDSSFGKRIDRQPVYR